jgi:hypothetical protein
MNPAFSTFQRKITNRLTFRLFMLKRLPAAYFAGLSIVSLDEKHCAVAVRYKWFTQNPFRSMYFAVQSMAAEMSTGLLASGHVFERRPAISMLVVGVQGNFFKKVTGRVVFTCEDGMKINDTIESAIAMGEGTTFACRSVGKNDAGETVSEFVITWSFKARK